MKSVDKVGADSVVQICMDNASANMSAARELAVKYPTISYNNCAAHCLNLLIKDICEMPGIKEVIPRINTIVVFVHRPSKAHRLFMTYSKLELLKPGVTRFGSQVIMLERYLAVIDKLRQCMASADWRNLGLHEKNGGKEVEQMVRDFSLQTKVEELMAILRPPYELLRYSDDVMSTNKQSYMCVLSIFISQAGIHLFHLSVCAPLYPSIHHRFVDTRSYRCGNLFGDLLHLKEKLDEGVSAMKDLLEHERRSRCNEAEAKQRMHSAIFTFLKKRWGDIVTNDLHATAYLLLPTGSTDTFTNVSLKAGFDNLISKWCPGQPAVQHTLKEQLEQWESGCTALHKEGPQWAARVLLPKRAMSLARWWRLYGCSMQGLQSIAVKVLSQPITSSECERAFSLFGAVQRKNRRKMGSKKMINTVKVAYSMQSVRWADAVQDHYVDLLKDCTFNDDDGGSSSACITSSGAATSHPSISSAAASSDSRTPSAHTSGSST